MDPLSITASIIAVLQLTSGLVEYLNHVKDANQDRTHLATEVLNIQSLLIKLSSRLDEGRLDEAWYETIKLLAAPNGALYQYKADLEELKRKVSITSGTGKVIHTLVWKFKKAEVDGMLLRMERLKSHIQIGLELDHL
jgi:hypothetical protein